MLARRISGRTCGLSVALLLASEVTAQEIGSLAWFKQTWQEASEWTCPVPRRLRFEGHTHHDVDAKELATLASLGAREATHPAHSRWSTLNRWQQHPIYPGSSSVLLLTDGWRIDSEHLSEALPHDDRWSVTAEGTKRWQLRPGRLLITDKTEPLEHFSIDNAHAAVLSRIREHAWFGMGVAHGSPWKYEPVRSEIRSDGSWDADVATADGNLVKRYFGRLNARGHMTIERSEVIVAKESNAHALGQTMTFEHPFPGALLGVDWGASKVTLSNPATGFTEVRILIGIDALDPRTLDPLVLEPPLSGTDPIRGEVSFGTLREVARGRETRSIYRGDGEFEIVDSDAGAWWREKSSGMTRKTLLIGTTCMIVLVISGKIYQLRRS